MSQSASRLAEAPWQVPQLSSAKRRLAGATAAQPAVLQHMVQLDSLRGIAVLFVLIHHWIRPDWYLNLGYLGVSLFFVLSGFLITRILLAVREAKPRPMKRRLGQVVTFYGRRSLRIFPVYYATLLVTYLLGFDVVRTTILWHAAYLSNVLSCLYPGDLSYVSHLWSLSVEEQFYLVWPWLVLFLSIRHLGWVFAGVMILGPLSRWTGTFPSLALVSLPLEYADLLGMGAGLALWQWREASSRNSAQLAPALNCLAPVALLAYILLLAARNRGVVSLVSLESTACAVMLGWVVLGASRGFRGPAGWLLRRPALVYLGRISYAIYLFHNFIPTALAGLSEVFPVFMLIRCAPSLRLTFYAATTLALASLSWFLFERPINRLRKHIAYR